MCSADTAFTIIELLVVMAVIIILAGLVLATAQYAQQKGARSRAEAEIAAMSAALESYKADNGIYPGAGAVPPAAASDTDALNAKADANPNATPIPNKYMKASLALYKSLTGDTDANGAVNGTETGKSYFQFKPLMLGGTQDATGNINPITHLRDPFGNSYGYSTANQYDPSTGYNPTIDLWSTAGTISGSPTDQAKWLKNW